MHIPKHYFHDWTVLALQAINILLVLFVILYVLLRVDPATGSTHIVQYRANMSNAFKSGSTNELRVFALFAALQYVFSCLLSVRLYSHRRHLAVVILALTSFMLVLTAVVSNAVILGS